MNRTPRRRISPRTVRRYRAFKNFVRRALGSSSQPNIRTTSSISVSVLDLRQKIDGIEQQLITVSKHCQDLASLESRLKLKDNLDSKNNIHTETKKNKVRETEVLYKTSQGQCDRPVTNNNKSTSKIFIDDNDVRTRGTTLNKMLNENSSNNYKPTRKKKLRHRLDKIEENERNFRRSRDYIVSRTLPANLSMYGSHSFNESRIYTNHLDAGYADEHRNKKKMECFETNDGLSESNNHKQLKCGDQKNYRNKYIRPELDQEFIADIIKRQYRPVKLLSRRESDFSQFSAPVCRDQEYPIRETLQEGSDLCSCCHKEHRRQRCSTYMCSNDLSDIRSICDTRLYSSQKHKHHTNHKKRTNDLYNDSAMYDVIPVKEKSSPKSRRKFVQDHMLIRDKYPEVPPSPRTQRPRLNLQAQFLTEDDEDEKSCGILLKNMKKKPLEKMKQMAGNVSNISSEVFIHNRNFKGVQNSQISSNQKAYNEECIKVMNNIQYPILLNEQPIMSNDITLNTQTTDVSADKTDKTLSEIKDILQNFLQEIKKESSQSDKFNNFAQSDAPQNTNEPQQQIKSNSFNNNPNFGYCGMPPLIQSFPNSCCYPMLPVCPINCMQNGFVLPSSSFTCATCANHSRDENCASNDLKNKPKVPEGVNNETQKLIKEIHNLISQNPNSLPIKDFRNDNKLVSNNKTIETKSLTTKNVGGSSKASKHDAKVGTIKMKCHSKSCEAIGSREATNTRYATTVSYSDTVLEKENSEEITTESASESEYSSELTVIDKKKENKFTKILRSMGVMKKKKSDLVEELSESNSRADIERQKQRSPFHSHPTSPFQQHILNYNMHGQQYFHPPIPQHQHPHEYCGHPLHYDPTTCCSPTYVGNKTKNSQRRHIHEQDVLPNCMSPHHIPVSTYANYYDPNYVNVPPQVPVCFKEIEVKSIGTQSVRKLSLLQKLTNKMQVQQPVPPAREPIPKQSTTRIFSKMKNMKDKPDATLFDWKKIHEKAMQKTTDPLKFTFKTQKHLAEGDNTMRNAMLKKLFYKRNPFSPRNLLVRTLLGKDRSSFGEPPKMYKPKMFL